jgi:hypothetical protein
MVGDRNMNLTRVALGVHLNTESQKKKTDKKMIFPEQFPEQWSVHDYDYDQLEEENTTGTYSFWLSF